MPRVTINNFGNGTADDYTHAGVGQSAISKHFDILTYPRRLQPIRGMGNTSPTEPSSTGLGAIILGSNGLFYGIGDTGSQGRLYKKVGTGASDAWTAFTTNQLSGAAISASAGHYDFLVHFPEMGATRKLFWSSTNLLVASDPADGGASADTDVLTFSTIGQGLVHPKDKILYFPYQTSSATLIGKITSHASDSFGTVNYTAFTLASRYRSYCLSYYGDYLAIPMTTTGGGVDGSLVGLWDRDTSLTTLNETIPWGEGSLKVLNNLNGNLIGISEFPDPTGNGTIDQAKIQIKVYSGGGSPTQIKEIIAQKINSSTPSCTINPRVNFVKNNRLYFSVNVVHGGTAPAYYGLWSVGLNKNNIWTVTLERLATNDGSDTGIIAAGLKGDFLTCVHTAVGTITDSINGSSPTTTFTATSIYETGVNPDMPDGDKCVQKQLKTVYLKHLPLLSSGQIVVKYRVDSLQDDSWTTIITQSTDDSVSTEATSVSGLNFTMGRNYEFRFESTGGAVITDFGYEYDKIQTLI